MPQSLCVKDDLYAICAKELVSQSVICAISAVVLVSRKMMCAICAVKLVSWNDDLCDLCRGDRVK